MKKAFLKLASAATAFTLLCTQAMPLITASAEEEVPTSGKCGIDLYWEYADGTLTISGDGGYIYEYYKLKGGDGEAYPWYPFREEITSVVFDENCNLEQIPTYAFYYYENLTHVTLSPKIRCIESSAIHKNNISEVYVPEGVAYISPKNFGWYDSENGKDRSDITVYGIANSAASNFCMSSGCTFVATEGELQEVNLTADTWNFSNSTIDFQETANVPGSYLTPEDLAAFKDNSTSNDYADIKSMIESTWSGACLGMSGLLTLCHNGILSPSDIQEGAETINEIQMNGKVESILNYYSIMLNGYAVQNYSNIINDKYTEAEKTESLLSYGQKAHDTGECFVAIAYGHTAHALVGVDMLTGQWHLGGNTYDTCVQMLDPNFPNQISMGSSVYINTENGNWILPSMDAGNTKGLYIGFLACTSSQDILNYRGLINGIRDYDESIPRYTEAQFLHFETEDTTLELTDQNGETLFSWSDQGDRCTDQGVIYPTDETVTLHRTIGEDGETLSSAAMRVVGYDYYYAMRGNGAEYMTIAPDGISFTISEWAAEHNKGKNDQYSFEPWLTFDSSRFQDGFIWDTIHIKISDSVVKDGSITQKENGYILSGDMLKDSMIALVELKTNRMKRVNLAVDEPSVFLTAQEDGGIAVMADKDNDGVYETMINQDDYPIPFDISFAQDILMYYALTAANYDVSIIDTEYWDVNNDGSIDIKDSAYVLQKYAEAAAGLT